MRLFDTDVQKLKYEVLREVARHANEERLVDCYLDIPKIIAPGPKPTLRCCIYKERAIAAERVKMAMGGNKKNPNIVEVIGIACDECPVSGYQVGPNCRGCIAHRCMAACPKGAISLDADRHARIDPSKCVNCGRCAAVCPYSAIQNHKRPCENACKVKAIHMDEEQVAQIDESKCIGCGSCVYQCPFGAIQDKSFLLDAIRMIKESEQNRKYKVYAIVAPSISSQFGYAKLGQVITALKKLGFFGVIEAALGADMVAWKEAKELAEKGFLTSSCCPAFVTYIEKSFPQLTGLVSHNLSPMAELARFVKKTDPTAKVVFIGPCTAKKQEAQRDTVKPYVDCVLTFEELQAWIDSNDFDITQLREDVLDNASFFGRIFARSGGLSDAVKQALKEQESDFIVNPVACDGIEQCRLALMKKAKNVLPENFIEGMACVGGCIGGAGCLTHGEKDKSQVDKYGKEAYEKTIQDALTQCSYDASPEA
ncbi:MAG: 4Fe-4S dicluster domain-containing protein [Eubacteriales bacterium]|nr:4Fe-4S dicluster domain-containing protein [Eubacteriales bacterium]